MTREQKLTRAAARLIKFGSVWDRRNGFDAVVPVVKAPVKKRVYKTGFRAAIRDGAASIMRCQAVVTPVRCVPANGNFAQWLARQAA